MENQSTESAAVTDGNSGKSNEPDPDPATELAPEKVRWCYKKNNEKSWHALEGHESLLIEEAYRRHQVVLKAPAPTETEDWAETAVALGGLYRMCYEPWNQSASNMESVRPAINDESEKQELKKRFPYRLKPIYWKEYPLLLIRGTWFLEIKKGDWQPLEGSGARLAERFKRYLNSSTVKTKLTHGYHTDAQWNNEPTPVTDLIFAIHGIGQGSKKMIEKIVHKVNGMRDICDELLKRYFKNDVTGRPMFLPVDWRTDLQLDEDVMADLTPAFLEYARMLVKENVMDLMYYASPAHGAKLTESLSNVLNHLYDIFVAHNSGFDGRVSFVAHSLGSVIAYDLLAVHYRTAPLKFSVHHMFCLGSPLGAFLHGYRSMSGIDILHPPGAAKDFRLHNVNHTADIVAFRIEPLVSRNFANVRPLQVRKFNAAVWTPYDSMPVEILHQSQKTENFAIPYRIDFQLPPERFLNKYTAYVMAVKAHFQYWTDKDVLMFVLTQLFGTPASLRRYSKKTTKKM